MPLKPDGLPRGPHAIHVRPHKKLGQHRTVIKAAWEIVNSLIDDRRVRRVHLRRVFVLEGEELRPRVQAHAVGLFVGMTVIGTDAAQVFQIDTVNAAGASEIAAELSATTIASPTLGVAKR